MTENDQKIIDILNQMHDMPLDKSYLVYITFCYKIIPLLDNDKIGSDYILDSVSKAKSFWFDKESSVTEDEIISRRVNIIRYMKEENISYDINIKPELKFSIIPLWTRPPSVDIGDSLDWGLSLLKIINISDNVIKVKLLEALQSVN